MGNITYNEIDRNQDNEQQKSIEDGQSAEAAVLELESNKIALNSSRQLDENLLTDNRSGVYNFTFSTWYDPFESCKTNFRCMTNFSTGWKDKTSLQFSTNNTSHNTTKIVGQSQDVKPKEGYHLLMHIKQNQWATQSRVALEGFNESSKKWYHIIACPSSGLKGSREWQEFSCGITLEENTTKVRPVLNAGWSSQSKMEATTWFDSIHLIEFRPFLTNPNLMTQVVYQGLKAPVTMAFLGPDDFLVTENTGKVQRIINGVKLTKPLIDLEVHGDGLLGIAVSRNINMSPIDTGNNSTYVFLYFVTNQTEYAKLNQTRGEIYSHLHRYELENNTLVNPKILLDLPAGYNHNGGPVLMASDNKSLYLADGDVENQSYEVLANKALNNKTGTEPDGTAGILHLELDGNPKGYVLGKTYPLNSWTLPME